VIEAALLVIFPLCMAMAAFSDMLTMTIPNRVSVILLASFILVAPLAGMGLEALALHIAAGLLVLAVVFALFALNVMGGGDAKLLAAGAVWFGLNDSLMMFMIYVAFMGGILTLLLLALRARSDSIIGFGIPVPEPLLYEKKIPYGIAIGIGGFLAYPTSPLMQLYFAAG
jgi:prepilin peptidase CpaA